MKICFHSSRYENKKQNFSLLPHSCCSCSTRIAFVSFVYHSCQTRVTCVSPVSHSCCSCCTRVALVSLLSGTRVVKQTKLKNLNDLDSINVNQNVFVNYENDLIVKHKFHGFSDASLRACRAMLKLFCNQGKLIPIYLQPNHVSPYWKKSLYHV